MREVVVTPPADTLIRERLTHLSHRTGLVTPARGREDGAVLHTYTP